ncbi:MAG: TonB-dependent receptor [Pseudomonadota bacterium]|nr:TonB-dependent receptor [Pseudomonadota bacterium]
MIKTSTAMLALGTAVLSAGGYGLALAAGADSGDAALSEIVVTATKQAQSLSRVAESVSVLTQNSMDERSIRSVNDLAREVPGLTFRNANVGAQAGAQGPLIAIRGVYSNAGAATTGVYLDDVPLQKRMAPGAGTGNGTPVPELYDLQRVEVLRGPQGTLFGGSSEGGAIRFITPTPSLRDTSGSVRVEGSATRGGDPSGEVAAAFGAPIVNDLLGFRISVVKGHEGGYISHVNVGEYANLPLGAVLYKNSNSENHSSGRAALLWQPTENLQITPSVYLRREKVNDVSDYWSNIQAVTSPAETIGTYHRPAVSYPAESLGFGKTGIISPDPSQSRLDVFSLTINHHTDFATLTSVTGYSIDQSTGYGSINTNQYNAATSAVAGNPGVQVYAGYISPTAYTYPVGTIINGVDVGGQPNPATNTGSQYFRNHRTQLSEELRLSSPQNQTLSWTTGVFVSKSRNPAHLTISEYLRPEFIAFQGKTTYGPSNDVSERDASMNEGSYAVFGDATYSATDKLKLEAGVRVSREVFDFDQCLWGTNFVTVACTPTFHVSGQLSKTPVLPKFGVSYQLTENDMIYANLSRGFRNGGLNSQLPPTGGCAGHTDPQTYNPDYVWTYEGGLKVKFLDDRATVNASIYQTNWTGIQITESITGCPYSYVTNAGTARARGFDTTAQLRILPALTADIDVGYTDARYTQEVRSPSNALLVNNGDTLAVPPWTTALGLESRFPVGNDHQAYLRGDYNYTSPYHRTFGPGTTTYYPDVYEGPKTQITNIRAGMAFGKADVSLFVKNLFNSHDPVNADTNTIPGGRSGCTTAACTTYTKYVAYYTYSTFRPQEYGVTLKYSF